MKKICENEDCKKEFETNNKNRKTCSEKCRHKLARKNQAITQGKEFGNTDERECLNCGEIFKPESSKVKTCSPDCGYEYRSKTSQKATKLYKKCKRCKEEFIDKTYSKKIIYCKDCRKEIREEKKIKSKICECGQIYHKPFIYGKYCSSKCRRKYTIIDEKIPCLICGKLFKKTLDNRQTCGKKHAQELKNKNNIRRYGFKNPMQVPEFKQKAINTNLEVYGETNPSKSPIIINRIIDTNMEKYGAHSKTQANIEKRIRELFNNKEFLENLHINQQMPMLKISKEYGVGDLYVAKQLRKFKIPIQNYKSGGEREVSSFLENLGLEIIRNNRNILPSGKELDIYIPSKKIAIEYNGLHYHSERELEKREPRLSKVYHLNKTKEAESLGIQLIHIYEDEWNLKREIVESRLVQVLSLKSTKVYYARKCKIRELTSSETSNFLNTYHLYGKVSSPVKIGLIYNNEIIACMTFGNLRKNIVGKEKNESEYELLRFCSKGRVIGGASKLFKYFLKNYKPKRVISYADHHWTTSIKENVYDKLGFIKTSDGQPNYWYKINEHREHRYNWRKQVLSKKLEKFDPNLTEYLNMLNNNYDRIWGCGSLKYEYIV